MSATIDSFNKRRLRSSYASVIVSISLVLFLLGLLGLLLLNAEALSREIRENFTIKLMLDESAKEAAVREFQKELDLEPFVKTSTYISKDDAAAILQEEIGEEFLDFLGFNPLPNAIEVKLNAEFVENESLERLEKQLANNPYVAEIVFDRDLIQLVNDNIQKISLVLVGVAVLLLLISIALINSSIRLAIYSKRFLIKTMQLVGATRGFIQRPFILKSLKIGMLGALIASLILFSGAYYINVYNPELGLMLDPIPLAIVIAGIWALGLLISWLCTFFAVRKYLNLKTDQLYF